jgi:dolichol-phosphate mannosyltransferase
VSRGHVPDPEWPSLGVVVPVYNEATTINSAIREIAAVAEEYPGRAVVIAVDDGSEDHSVALLSKVASEIELFDLQRHQANGGYGEALRTGAIRARNLGLEYVAFIDSDLTNPPADLLKIGALANQGHAYIKASRFVQGGSIAKVGLFRRLLSRLANFVARLLFRTGVRDVTNGFRAMRTDLFCSWPLNERGFAVIVEEFDCALRSGVQPIEFPTVLGKRTGEQRATAFAAYSPRLILSYLRYPIRAFGRRLKPSTRGAP